MTNFLCNIWNVSHGSSAFLRTPNERTILFDAGASDDFSPAQHLNKQYGLNCKDKKLTWLIISHPDRDHIKDLPNVYKLLCPRILSRNKNIPPDLIYPEGTDDLQEPLKTYKEMDEKYNSPIGDDLKNPPASNWGDVLVESFFCKPDQLKNYPDDHLKNNLSLVSVVHYRSFEIVLPGDLEPLGWDALIDNTEIEGKVGKGDIRILVASHHGRRSGIRTDDEEIYDRFLKIMKPHLAIMSDKWGNETTDREAYESNCLGYKVYSQSEKSHIDVKVLTTKTNDFISIRYEDDNPTVVIP